MKLNIKNSKGQVSIEILVILGVLILGTIILAVILFGVFNNNQNQLDSDLEDSKGGVITNVLTDVLDDRQDREAASPDITPQNQTYNLDLIAIGNGTVESSGSYSQNESVTVTAIPDSDNEFINWTDDSGVQVSDQEVYTFNMPSNNLRLYGNFQEVTFCNLDLEVSPASSGTVSGSGTFPCGEEVTIQAFPESDYSFLFWEDFDLGTELSNDQEYTFTLEEDKILIANFLVNELPWVLYEGNKLYIHPTYNYNNNRIVWGIMDFITNANSRTDGQFNTSKAYQMQGTSFNYATRICEELNAYGYNDWYLPARDELQFIVGPKCGDLQKTGLKCLNDAINKGSYEGIWQDITWGYFWSSSEHDHWWGNHKKKYAVACSTNFGNNFCNTFYKNLGLTPPDYPFNIRCVRKD
jgi:hypothetical protein